jgi:hypothetical protein
LIASSHQLALDFASEARVVLYAWAVSSMTKVATIANVGVVAR